MSEIAIQAIGKWPSILQTLGVDQAFLQNKHGPCPCCGGKDRFRFDNKNGKGSFICAQCGAGDGFTLLQRLHGWSFKEAASKVESIIGRCVASTATPAARDLSANEARLLKIKKGLTPIAVSDIAGIYLRSRGITILPKRDVYFHPGLDYWNQIEGGKPFKIGTFPAMVSAFKNVEGELCSYHVTYLEPDGKKLNGYQAKKMMPPMREMSGGAIQLGGIGETMIVAEGIETALAAQQEIGYPAWAAASATLLEKVNIPAFVKKVIIAADEDKNFAGQKAAYALANRLATRDGKEVVVSRLLGKEGPVRFDTGIGCDFLDYCQAAEWV